jgi:immunity protein 35 of polymorphic toxin system
MISRQRAEELVRQYLDTLGNSVAGGVALMPESTIEKPYGWVFFFNSKRFLETRDPLEALGGNSPILIDAEHGGVTLLGTALPVAESLRRLEIERGFAIPENE